LGIQDDAVRAAHVLLVVGDEDPDRHRATVRGGRRAAHVPIGTVDTADVPGINRYPVEPGGYVFGS
jgi:hypothetical protein